MVTGTHDVDQGWAAEVTRGGENKLGIVSINAYIHPFDQHATVVSGRASFNRTI